MRPNYPPLFDIIVDFICEKGMTFREFIASDYNISLTPIMSDRDVTAYLKMRQLIMPSGAEIISLYVTSEIAVGFESSLIANLDDVIIENTTYETTQ